MSQLTKEYIAQLDKGVRELFASGRWQDYLAFLSRFHRYSVNNTIAIYLQRPDASLVASFSDWQKQGRQVKKGEKGIRIIAPHTYADIDPQTGEEKQRLAFHLAHCFDVSQTAGRELPQNPAHDLSGTVAGYDSLVDAIRSVSPAPVSFQKLDGSTHGYFSPRTNDIVISTGLSDRQTVKTLIHEIAHAHLHSQGADEEKADQRTREVQAESVAYAVCRYLGIDSSDYSFGYIAGWSKDKTLPELRASVDAVTQAADAIIGDLERLQDKQQQKGAA